MKTQEIGAFLAPMPRRVAITIDFQGIGQRNCHNGCFSHCRHEPFVISGKPHSRFFSQVKTEEALWHLILAFLASHRVG